MHEKRWQVTNKPIATVDFPLTMRSCNYFSYWLAHVETRVYTERNCETIETKLAIRFENYYVCLNYHTLKNTRRLFSETDPNT